jgi:meso-butanediol dehydrogenase/(S,S)-butanediol dehydrogenase/diacetyl reductase
MANKTALITGAAGGIGAALAKRFAARDFNLALVDVDEARLNALVADLGLSNASAVAVAADVSKEADVNEYVRRTTEKFGAIDCFANNAAIEGPSTLIEETTVESFDRVYAINVRGVFLGLCGLPDRLRRIATERDVLIRCGAESTWHFEAKARSHSCFDDRD